ncbi:MAG: FtsH protease activity modulator HflK [Candidatus Marinimicrobia bacterium]|nr:FtsH protease activity modulator HflK [Candidatus Neomarinimicrobiota bacterium]MCF7829505.1 FtsH protease activity modulator HflK [Candidatus Neomarinimicrobiota bacterium]MCF7880097.1 FtsH protease activity modulator HflK [Candidatus Neomarinimicrobiota bacterium]
MAKKRIIIGGEEFQIPDLNFKGNTVLYIIGAVILLWLASGIYVVGPDEVGVVRRFGEMTRQTTSGMHYHLPAPFEQVDTPKVTEVKRIEVGFRSIGNGRIRQIPNESLMLTGDENIVDVQLVVQYRIKEPENYLFEVRNPSTTIHSGAEAALRQVVGARKIDEALTTGKAVIQDSTHQLLQSILDRYQAGIHIVAAQLQDVQPPQQVVDAFKDVASAKEDKNRIINQAEGYRNDVIPKARGEGEQLLEQARGYKQQRIKNAQGDSARFVQLVREYRRARSITEKRLYLETMEEILPGIQKYIIDSEGGDNVLKLLNLDGKGGRQ